MPKRIKLESKIQAEIINFLTLRGWFVLETHGNLYQKGFPDLYACKRGNGSRWIEIKCPDGYQFTPAQYKTFPRLTSEGVGIWIMTAATQHEYAKLSSPANWWHYYK